MSHRSLNCCRWFILSVAVIAFPGCTTVATQSDSGDTSDPWESTNRTFYAFNDTLDRTVLEPVANLYLKLPGGFRDSIHNFFDNAGYLGTAFNQLLQGKFEDAILDSTRFVFNSTLGLGGLFDVSTGFGLERHDEDFGQTLAVWGVDEGNFINYPFFGPSSTRDTPGIVVDTLTDVITYVALFPIGLLETIDTRANLAGAIKVRDQSAFDPYIFTREAYRQRRTFLVYDGTPPIEDFDESDEQTVAAQ